MYYDAPTRKHLIQKLEEVILPERWQKFHEVINQRTRHVCVVLEDIFQPHNASAVIRTADCMGIQDIHVVENWNKYNINKDIVLGADKWVDITKYNEQEHNILTCYQKLRTKGYTIIATSPHKNNCNIEELNLNKKTAIVLGSEKEGLSNLAIENADAFVKIPMYGFTESLNISVTAAIVLHDIIKHLKRSDISWQLSDEEKESLLIHYGFKTIKSPKIFINRMLKEFEQLHL